MWEYLNHKIHEISTVSTAEYALSLASWHSYVDPQFQCGLAEEKFQKRKDALIVIKYERERKGCGVLSNTPKVTIDGIHFHSCLCHDNFKDYSFHDNLFIYKQFDKGMLAYKGALTEQPAKYVELMQLFDRLHQEYKHEMQKQQKE